MATDEERALGLAGRMGKGIDFLAKRHPACVGAAALLSVGMTGALLVWFTVFSGLTGPAQFVYASF